jgi:catechol 2,3-dioxygenase-like lactoylglutathione lyase family enzyme
MEFHRGRLIDHLGLVVKDVEASYRFYAAVFAVIGVPLGSHVEGDHFYFDELFIASPESKAAAGQLTGRIHLAFQGRDRAQVERFHADAIAAGGRDNGKPGERHYHPGYYGAFVLDPDGNNIEVVYHGPAKASASSIVITVGTT